MLLLKILIVPLFLAGISLASRRWGAHVGGLLAGFPVVTGPILVLLSIEQGPRFASQAALGALLAVVACVMFGLAFAHAGKRVAWPLSVLSGVLAWAASAGALSGFSGGIAWAACVAMVAITAGVFLLPRPDQSHQRDGRLSEIELGARMVAGAALVVVVTAMAASVGTRWAGLIAMFPVMGSVLGVFSLRRSGAPYVARLFRGMFRGFYSFAAFCASLSLWLESVSAPHAFIAALALALAVQAVVYRMTAADRRAPAVPAVEVGGDRGQTASAPR